MTEAFVCDAIRTPIGRFGGALAPVRTDDLAAHPIQALTARNPEVDWDKLVKEDPGRAAYARQQYADAKNQQIQAYQQAMQQHQQFTSAQQADMKRAEMLQEIEQILFDEAAFVPLHWQNLSWASRKGVDIAPIVNAMNFPYLGDLVIK